MTYQAVIEAEFLPAHGEYADQVFLLFEVHKNILPVKHTDYWTKNYKGVEATIKVATDKGEVTLPWATAERVHADDDKHTHVGTRIFSTVSPEFFHLFDTGEKLNHKPVTITVEPAPCS